MVFVYFSSKTIRNAFKSVVKCFQQYMHGNKVKSFIINYRNFVDSKNNETFSLQLERRIKSTWHNLFRSVKQLQLTNTESANESICLHLFTQQIPINVNVNAFVVCANDVAASFQRIIFNIFDGMADVYVGHVVRTFIFFLSTSSLFRETMWQKWTNAK